MNRSQANNLTIILGVLLISASLVGITYDVQGALPGLLSWPSELAPDPASQAEDDTAAELKMLSKLEAYPFEERQPEIATPAPEPANRKSVWLPVILTDQQWNSDALSYGEEPSLPPTPEVPEVPIRLVIPAILLDAPIIPAETQKVKFMGQEYQQWLAPSRFAAGWHADSALLGETGNTVLNGHHNIFGEVFGKLVDLEPGDIILVHSETKIYSYVVTNKMIRPEKYQQVDVRMDNAQWILPSQDERLTLITCWPETSNTHRLVIVASPLPDREAR